ncbi:outer membrane protein transport protein [Lutibacter sp.]|uniref:OmpP1/FadL family transporter n=1 Tax=Lutibacter sp. TaxID=1925666 RepID=UPI0025BD143E|nr:outer membrane protein transport protein [Lutibacter sp.]MCF6181652.1 outer membrane protein transport protein [Lutibacter sp.]
MKKLFLIAMLSIAYITTAQTLSYNDIGVLFSHENTNGTARFNAMSGAFGALGGDISAMDINPAGAAVFLKSEFAVSLNNRNTQLNANYYGNNEQTENDYTNLSQAGGVFVFRNFQGNQGWQNVAIGFNYSISNDFENQWFANGNSGFAPITDLYDNNPVVYGNSDGQHIENYTSGKTDKYTFSIASEYNDNLYLGAAISTYNVNYYQNVLIEEYNNDGSGNTFDVSQTQELSTYGDGFSFNLGLISKLNENVRLGLAYQSPIWYTLSEDSIDYDVSIYENDINTINDYSGDNAFDYKLRTPSKLTGSFAYIFDKQGLISVDYSYKNYSNITLTNANFSDENQAFNTDLKGVGELRIGTEWRFDNISLRGGYHIEKSPYKNALSSDNIDGFSLGAGFKFKGGNFDVAYQKSSYTAPYNVYPQYNQVDATNLNIDNSKLTATLVLNL